MEIRVLGARRLSGFTYFWAKPVEGFNSRVHCARSLVGAYDNRFHPKMAIGRSYKVECEAPYFYLCGVTYKVQYHGNLHIAMRPEAGSGFTMETFNGLTVEVEGASRVDFPALPAGWNGLPPAYTTCRNFQFGVHAFGYG